MREQALNTSLWTTILLMQFSKYNSFNAVLCHSAIVPTLFLKVA